MNPASLPSSNPTGSFWQTSHPNRVAEYRSTLDLPTRADVVVIGTGISGTFAVDELLSSHEGGKEEGGGGQLGATRGSYGLNGVERGSQDAGGSVKQGSSNAEGIPSSSSSFDRAHVNVLVIEARTTCSAATGRNGGHLQPVVHAEGSDIIDFELRSFRHIEDLVRKNNVACDFRRCKGCLGFWNKTYFEEAKAALGVGHAPEGESEAGAHAKGEVKAEAGTEANAVAAADAAAAAPSQTNPKPATTIATPQHRALVRVVEDPEALARLRLQPGAVGAIVQDVAASLSPYKLVIWMWERLLGRFDATELNLQTRTAVVGIERVHGGQDTPHEEPSSTPGFTSGSNPTSGFGDSDDYIWLVHTSRGGPVAARRIIVATNAYTSHILPKFRDLIAPVQAQMSALLPPPGSPFGAPQINLIPTSFGFEGIGDQDRVMGDYLVQNPHIDESSGNTGSAANASSSGASGAGAGGGGGHLMYGGGRHLARNAGVGISDDSYVEPDVELYLRNLPERLNLDDTTKGNQDESMATSSSSSPSPSSASSPHLLDIAASWTGIIGSSADGHPWVGPVPDAPGIFMCAGYSGHGMTNAPLCGRHVGALVRASLNEDGGNQDEGVSGVGDAISATTTTTTANTPWPIPREYVLTKARMDAILQTKRARL